MSTQIDVGTRTALEAAAKRSGRKISGEVAFRLNRSFAEDEKITDVFGGREIYGMLRLVAAAMIPAAETAYWHAHPAPPVGEQPFPPPEVWLGDPDAYAEMVAATMKVLDLFRPPGSVKFDWETMGAHFAEVYSRAASAADGSIPLPSERVDRWDFFTRRLGADLGPGLRRNAMRNLASIPTSDEIIAAEKREREKKQETSS